MRNLNSTVQERIDKRFQTIDDNANPALYARLMRHTVPMGQKYFIERTIVKRIADITDSDVAVCHPRFLKDDEEIWVAYISGGDLHIRYTKNYEVLTDAIWHDYSLVTPAEACAIAFDSTVKKNAQGIAEFVTERVPWVFWIEDGALKAKLCTSLGGMIHELALENVTDVSAVRGPSGERGNWNLGLTVFFVMAGKLYYRQLIDGEWCDAERITFAGLSELTIAEIKAFNTWDYRVGLQILTDDNKLYELFSYTEGIGTRGTEHLNLGVVAEGHLFRIGYGDGYTKEHLNISVTADGTRIYGLSAIPLEAKNINVSGDWGKKVEVTMDYPTTEGEVEEFILKDSNNNVYACENIEHEGNVVRLTFVNFNMAYTASSCQVIYTKGTMMSPVVVTESFEIPFVPTNLDSPTTPPPSVISITNM